MAIVYRHIRKDKNEPFYIGIGETEKRAYSKFDRNKYWKNISKNGYEVEILFDNLSWEDACEKEKEFIQLYGRKDLTLGTLVNMTDGGDGRINSKAWNKGKQLSEEHRLNLKKNHKGLSGKKLSETHKDKIKKAVEIQYKNNPNFNKGELNGFYGKNHSEETKLKMRQAWIKRKEKQQNG